jgi:hypothetical protein
LNEDYTYYFPLCIVSCVSFEFSGIAGGFCRLVLRV